jgi:hypothetical protein
MTRARIEGLIASFPKLTSSGQQHTTIETDHVRYVYQPLEELFIVLITNKQSNILQGKPIRRREKKHRSAVAKRTSCLFVFVNLYSATPRLDS